MKKLFILLAISILLSGFSKAPGPDGQLAKDFTLMNLSGQPESLSSYRGGAVLVTFFTTWCPSCQDEMPGLEPIFKKYHSRGFHVIGVCIKDDADTVKSFVKEYGLTYPVLLDKDGKIARTYGVHYIPRSFLIDKDGNVRYTTTYSDPKDIEKEVVKVME